MYPFCFTHHSLARRKQPSSYPTSFEVFELQNRELRESASVELLQEFSAELSIETPIASLASLNSEIVDDVEQLRILGFVSEIYFDANRYDDILSLVSALGIEKVYEDARLSYFYSSALLALEDYDGVIEFCDTAIVKTQKNLKCVFLSVASMAYRSKKMFLKAGRFAVASLKDNANYPVACWVLMFLPAKLNADRCAEMYVELRDIKPNGRAAELVESMLIELAFGGGLIGEGGYRTRQLAHGKAVKIASGIGGIAKKDLIDEPDFIILGMPKCGTTSLFGFLMSRPDVVKPTTKEMGYFNMFYDRGSEWYRASFPHVVSSSGTRLKTGEASPGYIYSAAALDRIASDTKATKFLIMTRDPVKKAISGYYQTKKMDGQALEIEDFMNKEIALGEKSEFLQKCNFKHYINEVVSRFGNDRVMVIDSETLFTQGSYLEDVLDFLGLDTHDIGKLPHANKGRYPNPSETLRSELRTYFDSL